MLNFYFKKSDKDRINSINVPAKILGLDCIDSEFFTILIYRWLVVNGVFVWGRYLDSSLHKTQMDQPSQAYFGLA
jgi:hypothetical protein